MDTITAIKSRRAVKHFDTKHKMMEEEIKELMSLAILSHSALNIQHWRERGLAACGAAPA